MLCNHIFLSIPSMRVVIPFLLCLISFVNIATAEVTCSTPPPEDGCEAGCYELSGACIKCKDSQYSSKGAKDCSNCTNIPNGAPPTGPSTSESCTWKTTCNAGQFWDTSEKKCKSCTGNTISSESNIVFDGTKISGNTSCTACSQHTEANDNHTECIGKVYRIDLKKNTVYIHGNFSDHTVWVQYGNGFSKNNSGPFTYNDISQFDVLQPDKPVDEFMGYYTESKRGTGSQRFTETGALAVNTNNKSFTEDTTLYAQYSNNPYYVTYIMPDTSCSNKSQTCDRKNADVCKVQNVTSSCVPQGKYLNYWQCSYDLEGTKPCSKARYAIDEEISKPDTQDEVTRYLTAIWSTCPAGKYCMNGESYDCPAGATSDEGSSAKSDCHIVRGTSGTVFCDGDGCFTLPGTGNIPWTGK